MSIEARWYVVHTYSGYENKVKANLENIIENRNIQDLIPEVKVPMQDVTEIKNGIKKVVPRKVFPGYVLVKMLMNDDTWYIVRNIRGVTGFVGPGSKPVALTEEEIKNMGIENLELIDIGISANELIKVTSGPFKDSTGVVREVNKAKKMVTVMLSIFGRDTPVELDITQVTKM
ncbi:MAG TPA: transcription termination/antitermination protein NusG [Clostridiales bacterium]|nr:MAG: transcription termination/antitermination protein NusG [Clostridiales bacterium GWD2_32_19]HCC07460.1 transcription termination/antitermination protein NusG [Clostridiales bacterium]